MSDYSQNEGIDIDNVGPTAGGMINQQTIFVYSWRGERKQKYTGYNKYYLLFIIVVLVFVSYFHIYCDFVRKF